MGFFIGYSEDSFTPSEFDVTDALKTTGNTIVVACYEFTSASWLEDQDFWRLHGLFRSVHLDVIPEAHVEHIQINSDYDYRTGKGELSGFARVRACREGSLRFELVDAKTSKKIWDE